MKNEVKFWPWTLGGLVILEPRVDDEGVKWGHVQVGEFTEGSLIVNWGCLSPTGGFWMKT